MRGGAIPRTTLQILLALAGEPRHGYGIKLDIEQRTDGAIRMGSGTLYEAIQRMLACGWIEEVSDPDGASAGPPRRFYALTPAGRDVLHDELASMQRIVRYARDKDFISESSG